MEESVSAENELISLREEVGRLRLKVVRLEDEADQLAVAASQSEVLQAENSALRQQVKDVEASNSSLSAKLKSLGSESSTEVTGSEEVEDFSAPFVIPKKWTGASEIASIPDANSGLNVLCARGHPLYPNLVASGGVDRNIVMTHVQRREEEGGDSASKTCTTKLTSVVMSAPVLCMEFHPSNSEGLLAASCMDGSIGLVKMCAQRKCSSNGVYDVSHSQEDAGNISWLSNDFTLESVGDLSRDSHQSEGAEQYSVDNLTSYTSYKDHSKYVVCCRWSRDGNVLATASHDKSVTIYRLTDASTLEKVTKLYFPEAVEALEFIESGSGTSQLVIASREQSHLTYVDMTPGADLAQTRVSLNANAWDTHVSFNVMGLQASSDGRYILAATDKARIIMYRANHNDHVRVLVGHNADAFFQPKAIFSSDDGFAICNSMDKDGLWAYDLASGKPIQKIKGHTGAVRDIAHHPASRLLYTASYDKTVKLWNY